MSALDTKRYDIPPIGHECIRFFPIPDSQTQGITCETLHWTEKTNVWSCLIKLMYSYNCLTTIKEPNYDVLAISGFA